MYNYYSNILNPTSKNIVIWDVGHGINTPGKRAEFNGITFFEWSYNRCIEKFAMKICEESGINFISLVPENKDIPLISRNPFIDTRISRLYNIKKKYPGYNIFVCSIHGNAAGVEQANGYEIFTSPYRNISDSIATIFYNNAKELGFKMRNDWSDGDPDKEAKFTILTESPFWAVLVENGFYTNYKEAIRMSSFNFQKQIGENLVKSVEEVFNNWRKL